MKKKIFLVFVLVVLIQNAFSQELTYVSPNAYNFTISNHTNTENAFTRERTPSGATFNNDGSKYYTIGKTGDRVMQYRLSPNYDISTAIFEEVFDVSTEDINPEGITFNNDGSNMYIVGDTNDRIYEYALSTSYDVSTATITDNLDVSTQTSRPNGMIFNDDGLKIFVIGRTSDAVFEYDLTIAYDISTAVVNAANTLDISSEELNGSGLSFDDNGDRLFIIGYSGDEINLYDLGTAYDLSTATFNTNESVSLEDTSPRDVFFNDTGSRLYVVGNQGDDVTEYALATNFDLTTKSVNDTTDMLTIELSPNGVTFNNDGSKVYITGSFRDFVVEFNLSTNFDLSTASYNQSIYVNAQDSSSESLRFNNDGLKLFILGNANNSVFEYNLTVAYDIGTLVYSGNSFDATTEDASPRGLHFNNDGSKMYIAGDTSNSVYEYDLGTSFDLSGTVTLNNTLDVSGEETAPNGIDFSHDGFKMFISGSSGDDINTYNLSTAFDISTAVFSSNFSVVTQDGAMHDLAISNDGTTFFTVGSDNDSIYDYKITDLGDHTEDAVLNDGSIKALPNTVINLTGDTFIDLGSGNLTIGGANQVTVGNVPAGLTPVLALSASNTRVTLSFTGTATSHQEVDNVTNLTFTFNNSAFVSNNAALVTNAVAYNSNIGVLFFDNLTYLVYVGPNSYNIANIEYNSTFSVAGSETTLQGLEFNYDGSKMYAIGSSSDNIIEYSLSTNFDTSTAVLNNTFSVNSFETSPNGLTFNKKGTKLFVIGTSGDDVNEFDLSAPFDISTAVFSQVFSVAAQETIPRDLTFSSDGLLLFIIGNNSDNVVQYNLVTAYDISTASYSGTSFSVNPQEGSPRALAFSYDGNTLFVAGSAGDDVNEYSLTAAFDISAPTFVRRFSFRNEDSTITGLAFNPNGTKVFSTGSINDSVYEYDIVSDYTEESSTNNGNLVAGQTFNIYIEGDTFDDTDADNQLSIGGGSEVSIANIPAGLTPTLALNVANTIATLTFAGTATNHADANDVASLDFTFTDSAFSTFLAADIENAVGYVSSTGVNFNFCPRDIRQLNNDWIGGSGVGGLPNNSDDLLGIYVADDVELNGNVDCFCLEVKGGNTLSISDTRHIDVQDMVKLDGDIRLIGNAQLIQLHTGVKNAEGTGSLYIDQAGTLTNVYQSGYWTSPVTTNGTTFTISGVLKDGTTPTSTLSSPPNITFTDIHTLDGSKTVPITISGRWLAKLVNDVDWTRQISPTVVTFNPGEGWNMKSTGGGTQNYTFVGRPNDGDYTSSIDQDRLSLIGNPYPSAIDADQFLTDNTAAIDATLYFYEAGNDVSHVRGVYTGGYATRVAGVGTPFGVGKTPSQYVGVGQAFFVTRSAVGTGIIDFNNAQRIYQTIGAGNEFFSKTAKKTAIRSANFPIVRLGFEFSLSETEIFHRQLAVAFRGKTTSYENGFDAEMFDRKPSDLALKVADKETPFVITGIQDFNEDLEIPISVFLDETRDVTFKIDGLENFTNNLFLKDSVNNTYFNLTEATMSNPLNFIPVTLNLDEGNYLDRFFITFKKPSLGITDAILQKLLMVFVDNKEKEVVITTNNNPILNVSIYNLLGQKVKQWKRISTLSSTRLDIKNLSPAIYLINIRTEKGIVIKKIILK